MPKPINVCLSGGSMGADVTFGEEAQKAGHQVIHWSFFQHYASEINQENIQRLTHLELAEADVHLRKANETLKRTFPTNHVYMDNLLRRNWWQVKDTERVYAVAAFEADSNRIVVGGTAWAVQMAIDSGVSEIYFFDQIQRMQWFFWDDQNGFEHINEAEVPIPYGWYTGIGSRNLNKTGERAIRDLYGNL